MYRSYTRGMVRKLLLSGNCIMYKNYVRVMYYRITTYACSRVLSMVVTCHHQHGDPSQRGVKASQASLPPSAIRVHLIPTSLDAPMNYSNVCSNPSSYPHQNAYAHKNLKYTLCPPRLLKVFRVLIVYPVRPAVRPVINASNTKRCAGIAAMH